LRRPKGFRVISLLIVFRPEGGRRNERVSDEFVSVFESITFLIEIDDFSGRFSEEKEITQIPVSRDKKDLLNGSGLGQSLEEREKKLVDEGFLIWDHLFVSLCWGQGGKKVAPDRHDFRRGRDGQRQDFLIKMNFTVEIRGIKDFHPIPQSRLKGSIYLLC
jgi:hypothetical protein